MSTAVLQPEPSVSHHSHPSSLARYPLTQGVNPWLVTVSVMLPTFMEVLDTAIASVALPYIAGSLSASNSEATWVLTSYLVANAVILPAANWFARKFGRKRFLLFCVVVFTIASFFCGAAPSLAIILLARVLQGAGGGALQPISQSILLESFPVQKRSQAMAAYGLGIVVAPVLGPTLGGWLTDTFSWRYAFYINIPVGILAVILISRFVHDPPYIKNAKVGPFDNLGFGMLVVWTGCLQVVLDKGQEDDWFGAVWVRWAVGALIVALVGWVWRSWTNPRGLVDLHILKNRNFRTGCFLIALLGMCIYITIAILPLYYQEILGYTAFTAGLVVGPRGVGSFVGSPVIGILGSRIDNRKLLSAGFIGFGICSLYFGMVNLDIGPYTLLVPILLTGFALSFVFVPLATLTTATIKREEMGNATGLFNMLRNIGGSIGIAMATTAIIRRAAFYQTEIGAHISSTDPAFQQKSRMISGYLGQHLGHAAGRPGAMGLLYGMMQQQSALRAYVDVFRWTALLAFFCAGAVWLFRKPPSHHEAPPGAH
ncbi:MAG TPA: DHA2 family efflux MFS transporter permease subunit [Terracidiphilus sp.]|jgi:DHA2 family multidrug resistance protein|nr:DHA2 family efflux MFS transporter permease subunit [Terracidiphilus sp.]